MAKALLDTDILSEYLKGHDQIVAKQAASYARQYTVFTFTSVTVYEIVYGFKVTNHRLEGGGYGNGLQVLFRPKAGRMAPAPSGLQEVDGLNHLLGSPRPSPCSDRRYTLQ